MNDMGDGAWATFYDQGSCGHCEATMLFDPTIPTMANSMQRYSDDCADVQYDEHLGGIGFGCPMAGIMNCLSKTRSTS
ncbi:MAG: hypothetical protein IKV99_09400 [Oscillospiraceae bacterium]|nr:hypothetical protein [Oscillospiraceae bacterium]